MCVFIMVLLKHRCVRVCAYVCVFVIKTSLTCNLVNLLNFDGIRLYCMCVRMIYMYIYIYIYIKQ